MTEFFGLILITNDPDEATSAESAGIERVMIDLEQHGKQVRQKSIDAHLTSHSIQDIDVIASVLTASELMVRTNALTVGLRREVDQVIEAGAQRLMLPMFTSRDDVKRFLELAKSRVPTTFLVETPQALTRLPDILPLLGEQDDIHIGLNDLSLGLGLDFLFEPLAGGLIDGVSRTCHAYGTKFGFGGIGAVGTGTVKSEWLIGEHVRLGSSWVILCREFRNNVFREQCRNTWDLTLREEVGRIRQVRERFRDADDTILERNRVLVVESTFERSRQVCHEHF